MDNLEERFNELVKKAEQDAEIKIKNINTGLFVIELTFQLIGFIIIFIKLGGWVTLGLFLLLTGVNIQNRRTSKK